MDSWMHRVDCIHAVQVPTALIMILVVVLEAVVSFRADKEAVRRTLWSWRVCVDRLVEQWWVILFRAVVVGIVRSTRIRGLSEVDRWEVRTT